MTSPVFLTEKTDTYQSRYHLWPLIPKDTLVVTEHIFHHQAQVSNMKSYLPDPKNQSIYLDLSHNPEVIDSPHAIEIYNRLKEVAPLKIVVNEYEKFYKPTEDFIYFPLFFYSYSYENYLSPMTCVNFPNFTKKTKPFMSLNNRPAWHRIWLFTELASNNLLNRIEYSFVWDPTINYPVMEQQLDQLPDHKRTQAESLFELLPIRFPHEHRGFSDIGTKLKYYNECAVNIVTETSMNIGLLSEKICKPLASYQIPILLSHDGATQFCQDLGFDMFEDIIPWRTWDSIKDEQQRCDVVCKFIVDYVKNGDALADWHRCQDRVIANRERLLNDEFKKFCTTQFKLSSN
jgi:hypothetical protein